MAVIPFGLVGAITGHWLMSIDLAALSMIGFFGLSGIVVNDSIILVSFYKELKRRGHPWRDSIVNAACLRLRAVLLTSLTTIGGLTPLMFGTSVQAQFLIPINAPARRLHCVALPCPRQGDTGRRHGPGYRVPSRVRPPTPEARRLRKGE